MKAKCACGATFEAQGTWQRLCWDCWRRRESQRAARGDLSQLATRQARILEEAYEAGRAHGYEEGFAAASVEARRRNGHGTGIDGALLRELLQLCHPDHQPAERGEQANRVTRQLLTLREGHA